MSTRLQPACFVVCLWQFAWACGCLPGGAASAQDSCWSACGNSYGSACSDNVYVNVEALMLGRDSRGTQPIVIAVQGEPNAFPGSTLLTAGDLNSDWDGGLRAFVGWQQDACTAWEVGYLGIFDWNASAVLTGNNSLAIPGDLGQASLDFFAADRMEITYRSQLHSAELNYVGTGGALALLCGFRYLALNEDFILRAADLDTGTSDYRIHSTNNLFGGQAGARYVEYRTCWGWEATAKAGLFGNAASQSQSVTDFPPSFLLRSRRSASSGQVAFVGDLNLTGFYQLTDNWSLRAGYNVLWIEGVVLAPNQLDFTDTAASGTQLHSQGGLFAHGVSLGLQANW
jgi:Putative beta barrel porin-7 (BBP7)